MLWLPGTPRPHYSSRPGTFLDLVSGGAIPRRRPEVAISTPVSFNQLLDGESTAIPVHRVAYFYLRQVISHYLATGGELHFSAKPHHAFQWNPPAAEQLDLEVDASIGEVAPEYLDRYELIVARGDDDVS